MALTSLWDDFGVMLWSLCASGGALGSRWGRFEFTLGAFGGPLYAYEPGLGTLWGRFEVSWNSPWVILADFGITLV